MSRLARFADWHRLGWDSAKNLGEIEFLSKRDYYKDIIRRGQKRMAANITPPFSRFRGYPDTPFTAFAKRVVKVKPFRKVNPYIIRNTARWAVPLAAYALYRNNNMFRTRYARAYRGRFRRGRVRGRKGRRRNPNLGRKKIGEQLNISNCKLCTTATWGGAYPSRALQSQKINDVPKATAMATDKEHSTRRGDVIKLCGIKINMMIRNSISAPCCVHVAILQPKRGTGFTTNNFFRDNGTASTVGRGRLFSTALTGMEFCHLGLNTDKLVVLIHKRFDLGAEQLNASYSITNKPNYAKWKKYIKVNKQQRFDSDAIDHDEMLPLYIVHWMDRYDTVAFDAQVPDSYDIHGDAQVYFREVRSN